jgi:hypothetical protein
MPRAFGHDTDGVAHAEAASTPRRQLQRAVYRSSACPASGIELARRARPIRASTSFFRHGEALLPDRLPPRLVQKPYETNSCKSVGRHRPAAGRRLRLRNRVNRNGSLRQNPFQPDHGAFCAGIHFTIAKPYDDTKPIGLTRPLAPHQTPQ